ncbi:MAG: MBL fold metallo-hydrolase [Hyphomicrobiales bacterium]|nr:MBL fold metallo-hydrolase [Hyphomicrobiales bacterium]
MRRTFLVRLAGLAGLAACATSPPAFAQAIAAGTPALQLSQAQKPKAEGCPPLLSALPPRIIPAAVKRDQLGLKFIGHSTFVIESPMGVRVATDFNDGVRPPRMPNVITMNRAHTTHYTDSPPPEIKHVLRGWNPAGGAAAHDVTISDMRIRNVVTNLRDWNGGTDYRGNSIFVFEASLLCVAHLGHLHHELTREHLKQLGRIDVALVPVDGSMTLNREAMLRVVRSMGAPLVVPMHYFGSWSLEEFITLAREKKFDIRVSRSPEIVLSRSMLPRKPTVLVLPGR